MTMRMTIIFALSLALAGAGCAGFVDEDEGAVPSSEIPLARQGTIKLQLGYADDKPVEYYRFGSFAPADKSWFAAYDKFPGMPVGEMYIWADSKGLPSLEGNKQHPIIDTLPLQARYTDFFEVVVVEPDGDTEPNDIKSRGTLLLAGLRLKRTGHVVNCPVVGAKAALASSKSKSTFKHLRVWVRKKVAYCMLMEGGSALITGGAPPPRIFSAQVTSKRTELRVAANDFYDLKTKAFSGADQVTNIPVPDNAVYHRAPGTKEYSPLVKLWDVTVPSDYKLGQINSYADLFPVPDFTDPRIEEHKPETFHNNSIVTVGK